MSSPSRFRFELLNGLEERAVTSASFVVYGHQCLKGLYIGWSNDPVKRWQEHCEAARTPTSPYYDDLFRSAIRGFPQGFKHYILAVASTDLAAKRKEAAAIEFYKPALNERPEYSTTDSDYGFRPIDQQIGRVAFLQTKRLRRDVNLHTDKDRIPLIAEIFFDNGRKRVRVISGQPFPAGMKIECPRSQREQFEIGQLVRVRVALANKNGTNYLVAGKSAILQPVQK